MALREEPAATGGRLARASLTRAAILAASLELVEQEGFDALTMRALATTLGAAPMALYRHFNRREELVAALLDELLGTIPLTIDESDAWTAQLRTLARAHHAMLLRVPSAIPSFLVTSTTGQQAVRFGEALLGVFARGGISGATAVNCFYTVLALNYGFASFEARRRFPTSQDQPITERIRRTHVALALMPEEEFPLSVALAGPLARFATDEAQYLFALDVLIAGFELTPRSPQ